MSHENKSPILIDIKVQVSNHDIDNIIIRESDDIEQVIDEYCGKRNYSDTIKDFIMMQIIEKMDENINKLEKIDSNKKEKNRNKELNNESINLSNSLDKDRNLYNLNEDEISQRRYTESSSTLNNVFERNDNKGKLNVNDKNTRFNKSFTKSHINSTNPNNFQDKSKSKNKSDISGKNRSTSGRDKKHTIALYNQTTNKSNIHGGERMYNNYIKKLKKKKNHIEKIQKLKLEAELKEASFKPSISPNSRNYANNYSNQYLNVSTEDRLLKLGKESDFKKLRDHEFKNNYEIAKHPYKPSINNTSKILAQKIKEERKNNLNNLSHSYINKSKSRDNSKSRSMTNLNINITNNNNNKNYKHKSTNNATRNIISNINNNSKKSTILAESQEIINNKSGLSSFRKNDISKIKNSDDTTFHNMSQTTYNNLGENHMDSSEELNLVSPNVNSNNPKDNIPVYVKNKAKSNFNNMKNSYVSQSKKEIPYSNRNKLKDKEKKLDKSNISNEDISILKPSEFIEFSTLLRKGDLSEIINDNKKPIFPRLRNTPITVNKNDGMRSKTSEKISKNENNKTFSTINNIHDELYWEKDLKNINLKNEAQVYRNEFYPFKPNISKSPNVKAYQKKESSDDFISRLVNSQQLSNDKYKHQKYVEANIPPSFRPNAYKYKNGFVNSSRKEVIHPNLDGFYDERYTKNKEKLEQEKIEFDKKMQIYYKTEAYKKILKIKMTMLKDIFDKLDSDKDGFISSKKIKVTSLDNITLCKLASVLEYMQKNEKEINFKEFYKCVESQF